MFHKSSFEFTGYFCSGFPVFQILIVEYIVVNKTLQVALFLIILLWHPLWYWLEISNGVFKKEFRTLSFELSIINLVYSLRMCLRPMDFEFFLLLSLIAEIELS